MKQLAQKLSVTKAAKILRVSAMTLRRWEAQGLLIPTRSKGGARIYYLEDILSLKKGHNRVTAQKVVDKLRSNTYLKDAKSNFKNKPSFKELISTPSEFKHFYQILDEKTLPALKLGSIKKVGIITILIPVLLTALVMGATLPKTITKDQKTLITKSTSKPITPESDVLGVTTPKKGSFAVNIPTIFSDDVTIQEAKLNAQTLELASDQLLINSGGVSGTLTWTPTGSAKTITLPDTTDTLIGKTTTDTLKNKSISGSDNTLTSIPNSALSNSKVTVSAGTNISGGGDVSLGSSVTLNLKDSISLSGTLGVSGTTTLSGASTLTGAVTASSTLAVTGATTLSSTLAVTGTSTLTGAVTTSGNVGVGSSLTVASAGAFSSGIKVSAHSDLATLGATTITATGLNLNLGSDAEGDLYYRNSSGTLTRLGIGSASQVLQVSSGLPVWAANSSSTQWTTSSNDLYFIGAAGTGNVGIGNTYANYAKLQVTGSGTGTAVTFQTLDSSGTQRFSVLDNGNVGIGTTNPDYNFKTQGTGYFSGFVGVGSSLNISGNTGIGQSLTVTSAGVFSSTLKVSGFSEIAGLSASNINATTLTTTGNVGVGASITGYGALNGLNVTGLTSLAGLNTSGNVGVGGSLTVTSGLSLPSNSILNSYLANSSISVSATSGTGLSISGSPVSLGGTLTIAGIDATTAIKGVASFNSTNFSVVSGAVNTIQDIATSATPSFVGLSTTSGNIGIGTSSTSSRLAVNGASVIGWGTQAVIGPTNGLGVFGNVGVGTTTADYNLSVIGTGNLTGNLGIGSSLTVTSAGVFSSTLKVSGFSEIAGLSASNINATTLTTTGNVGVGASITGYGALNGLNVTGLTNLAGLNATTINGTTLTTTGNVSVGQSLTVSNNLNAAAGFKVTGFSDLTGNVGVGQSLTVTSASILDSLSVTKSISAATLGISGASTLTGNVTASGNVGIGQSLTVTSAGVFSSGIKVSAHSDLATLGATTITATGLNLNLGSDATGDIFYRSAGGSLTRLGLGSANQVLTVSSGLPAWATSTSSQWTSGTAGIYYTGNVGIGNTFPNSTTSPFAKLQLSGAGTGTGLNLLTTSSSGTQGLAVLDNGNVGIGTTNPGGSLVVASGNVGIGFTTPDRLGQFASDINITSSNSSLLGAAGTQFSLSGSTGSNLQKKLVFGLDTTDNYGVIQSGNTSGTNYNLIFNPAGGNIGIGTTTPYSLFQIGTGTMLDNIFTVNSSGNVGVGTTSATAQLELYGTSPAFKLTESDFTIEAVTSTDTYTYTGSNQTWTVPDNITSITVKVWGGGGAGGAGTPGAGGGGGYATAVIAVTPGQTIPIVVGGGGTFAAAASTSSSTYGGGGAGGPGNGAHTGGAGGGYSGVFTTSVSQANSLVIAAGGGGGGSYQSVSGGAGGGTSGTAGAEGAAGYGGGAGTQSAGGGAGTGQDSGSAGSALAGGNANTGTSHTGGGGGGGGYYGGGGGAGNTGESTGAGGGGSSFIGCSGCTSASTSAGSGTTPGNSGDGDRNNAGDGGAAGSGSGGNGRVLISYTGPDTITTDSIHGIMNNQVFDLRKGSGTAGSLVSLDLTNIRVGIGTSTPYQLFQVSPSASSSFVVTSTGNVGIATTTPRASFQVGAGITAGGSYSVITSSGNVGIGTTSPNFALSGITTRNSANAFSLTNLSTTADSSTSVLRLNIGTATSDTSARWLEFYGASTLDNNGTRMGRVQLNNTGAAYNTGNADFAEYFDVIEPVANGDLIGISSLGNRKARKGDKLIGVVTDSAGFIGNAKVEAPDDTHAIVGLVGQVKTHISTENGPIKRGDYLTISSRFPGIAVKAVKPGEVVGRALEDYNDEGIGKIWAYIKVGFADPNDIFSKFDVDESGSLIIPQAIKTSQIIIDESLGQQLTTTTSIKNPLYAASISPISERDYRKIIQISDNELGFLRVREKPSIDSLELAKVNPTDKFLVLDQIDVSNTPPLHEVWYQINYTNPLKDLDEADVLNTDGKIGWVKESYTTNIQQGLSLKESTASAKIKVTDNLKVTSATSSSQIQDQEENVISKPVKQIKILSNELGFLRVREKPSTESEELARLEPGVILDILDQDPASSSANLSWYKIDFKEASPSSALINSLGWVKGSYVSISTPSASISTPVASASAGILPDKNIETLKLTPPDILLATGSAQLANLKVTSEASISGLLTSYDLNISNQLKSLGTTTLAKTNINGDLTIDGTLTIENGSQLNVIGTLFLQKSPLASLLDIFNSKVIIDNQGNIITQGNIIAKKVIIDTKDIKGATLGSSKLLASTKLVEIETSAVTEKSRIFITPTTTTNGQSLIISSKQSGYSFSVSIDQAFDKDILFDWLIVDELE